MDWFSFFFARDFSILEQSTTRKFEVKLELKKKNIINIKMEKKVS